MAEDAGELVGAGGAAAGAVDAAEALEGKIDGLALKQGAEGLEVAVAAAHVLEVVDFTVYDIEIDKLGAHQRAG